jgi:hypothetical protein
VQIRNLCVAVTFYYDATRLIYLENTVSELDTLADQVKLYVITNESSPNCLSNIGKVINSKNFKIISAGPLSHRFYLTWHHLEIFRNEFNSNSDFTHFMYLEDDIKIGQDNISYWLKSREDLKTLGFIPSFLRFEKSSDYPGLLSSDISVPMLIKKIPKIKFSSNYWYLNLSEPYQAMYLLDRELAKEHLFDYPLENRDSIWGVRETAASGLTFINVPEGFKSRNVVGFNSNDFEIDKNSLIHHLPNNYANNKRSIYGKLEIKNIILKKRNIFLFLIKLRKIILEFSKFTQKIKLKFLMSKHNLLN